VINIAKVSWSALTMLWVFVHRPHAEYYIWAAAALFVLLLFVAFRLMTWLEDSGAWPAVLVRLIGGTLLAGLAVLVIPACIFSAAVWLGGREADPQYAGMISLMIAQVLRALFWGVVFGFMGGVIVVIYLREPRKICIYEAD